MCGIAGAVFWDGPSAGVEPEAVVRRMTDALGHRGPDGQGVARASWPSGHSMRAPHVVLGHRRLAVIDLSDRAAQPMRSRQSPISVTYNGEIYNFEAVRRDLEARGRRFTSASDTEVLLQGYEEWGEEVTDRLRGMFAFAIWDGRTGKLILARDRLGIKPLYVASSAGSLLFASEIRALLASGLVERRLDPIALEQYLAYQTVPPPRTLVAGVRMVGAGHLAVAHPGRLDERRWWDLIDAAVRYPGPTTSQEARARIGALLADAIRLHLVSDVPVGVFLSGGLDSSVVAALVRHAGVRPRTFSVTFPGTPIDEGPYARKVARALEAEHTEIPVMEDELRQALPDALEAVDHPSGDGINTFVVARAVRRAGVKVALSGVGGDEFFGGYPSFQRLERLAAAAPVWRGTPGRARRAVASAVRAMGGGSVASEKAAAVLASDGTLPQAYPVLRRLFSEVERRTLLEPSPDRHGGGNDDPYVALLIEAAARGSTLGVMGMTSYAEARTYMHDVLLRDTDQMSMRHGLEVRVPLLDHVLVEYVMRVPESIKRSRHHPKQLLIDSMGDGLPSAMVSRPKQGFVVPFDLWMRGALAPFCEHHLGPQGLGGRSSFRPDGLQALWTAFLAGDRRTSWSRPWTLVALNAWLERNRIDG